MAASMWAAGDAPTLPPLRPARSLPFSPSKATLPDTAAYYCMRGMAGSSASLDDSRANLQKYLIMAQDHKRRGAREDEWITSDQFRRLRGLYVQRLKEASEALNPKANTPTGKVATPLSAAANTALQKVEQKKAEAECMKKLNQAAMGWQDPAIRSFLMGLVYMQSKNPEGKNDKLGLAEACFRECIAIEPHVAGFHQARGEAFSEMGRSRDAVAEFAMVVRLLPNSTLASDRLNAAMIKAQGVDITSPEYLQAKEVVEQHQGSISSGGSGSLSGRSGNVWLMPVKSGGGWPATGLSTTGAPAGILPSNTKENLALPTPPYDRLLFRQALAVPVGKNTLLVDGDALKDVLLEGLTHTLLEVKVQIDDRTLATAKVSKIGGDKNNLPLAVLTVSGYEFTPLGGDKTTKFKIPMSAHLYAANAYEEMGQTVRQVDFKVKVPDANGGPKIDEKVLPGETAAAVVSDDGVLAGFLGGKTDVSAEGGGANVFYPLKDILPLIGSRSRASGGLGGSTASPLKQAPGKCFLVHIVLGETF
jgi:tetratricopeptide (TPR) repeat protein